jgi:hypothetical protein
LLGLCAFRFVDLSFICLAIVSSPVVFPCASVFILVCEFVCVRAPMVSDMPF